MSDGTVSEEKRRVRLSGEQKVVHILWNWSSNILLFGESEFSIQLRLMASESISFSKCEGWKQKWSMLCLCQLKSLSARPYVVKKVFFDYLSVDRCWWLLRLGNLEANICSFLNTKEPFGRCTNLVTTDLRVQFSRIELPDFSLFRACHTKKSVDRSQKNNKFPTDQFAYSNYISGWVVAESVIPNGLWNHR